MNFYWSMGFPHSSVGKESACNAGDPQFDPWFGKFPWRRDRLPTPVFLCFPGGSAGKESTWNTGDLGSIPGLERSSGEGKGYPLQYSGLENSMECIVHGVAKSQTRLSDFHFHHFVGDFKVHLTCPYMASRNPVVHKCFKVFMGQLGFHFLSVSQGTSQGVGLWGGVQLPKVKKKKMQL